MRYPKTVGAAVIAMIAVGGSPIPAQSAKPEVSAWRITGEIVGGTAAGYVGYFAGRFVGASVSDMTLGSSGHDVARHRMKQGFGYTTAVFATSGAVYGIGSMRDQTGEFGTTLLGTTAGLGVAVAVTRLLWPPGRSGDAPVNLAMRAAEFVEVMLPSIGATIAFNSTRKLTR